MTDYHSDGTRKSIIELLMSYEKEIELSKKGNKEIHKDLNILNDYLRKAIFHDL